MPANIFPLVVFDFGASRISIHSMRSLLNSSVPHWAKFTELATF